MIWPASGSESAPDVRVRVAIFAHNEARRIAGCLESLPLGSDMFAFDLLVNGSSDATATIARSIVAGLPHFRVHELPTGGKARTWNHFVHDLVDDDAPAYLFVDGDAVVLPGAFQAMIATLRAEPAANGVNAMPVAGRGQARYRDTIQADHGLFGALYGLSGDFVQRVKSAGVRLPGDLIGDDGLIGAMAKTDLGRESNWEVTRIVNCPDAGFCFEETDWRVPATWASQVRRMVNYSERRYQNMVLSRIMREGGPLDLPATLRQTYSAHWHLFDVRPAFAPFDLLAKRRMRQS